MLDHQKSRFKIRRWLAGTVLFFVLSFSIPTAVLFVPKPAYAQWATISTTIGDIPRIIWKIKDLIWEQVKEGAFTAFNRAYGRFLQRMAYDYAVKLTTAGPGGKPLIFQENWKTFLKKAQDEAVGEFLDSASSEIFGRSLCEPFDPLVKLEVILKLKKTEVPPAPACTFNKIVSNVRNTEIIAGSGFKLSQLNAQMSTKDFYSALSDFFEPGSNQLGNFIKLRVELSDRKSEEKEAKKSERETAGPDAIQDLKTTVSGDTKTPAGDIADQKRQAREQAAEQEQKNAQKEVEKYGPIGRAFSIFANTLAERLMKKILTEGLFFIPKKSEPGVQGSGSGFAASSNTKIAKEYFAGFITPQFRSGGITDVTANLASCPSDPTQRAFNNCIVDNDFLAAVNQKMTLKEAIEAGLIDPNKTFGFNSDGSEPSYLDGYPYKSLVVLRKYRIIPVTWELAALYIRDIDQEARTYSLGDIIDAFDDPKSPFYHLIDPNWVLKVPIFECRFEGPGPQKLKDDIQLIDTGQTDPVTGEKIIEEISIIARADYCADDRSCIEEGPDGQCRKFGYCTAERDVWRFKGEQCEPQNASCVSLITGNGSAVSYLSNTLSKCDASQVGCSVFSASQNLQGEWAVDIWNASSSSAGADGKLTVDDIANRTDLGDISYTRYFNRKLENCSADNAGCSRFIELTDFYSVPTGYEPTTESIYYYVQSTTTEDYANWGRVRDIYLKKPPANLYCPTDVNDPNRDPECDNYLQWCEPEEAGCSLYVPINGDPPVPAVLQSGDYCDAQCAGYDQYLELPTNFSTSTRQVDLIPETAASCTLEEVGCERFTNLDEVEKGGEGIEYFSYIRGCILPDDPSAKIFYTWEGSDTTGYQLKTWRLKAEPNGSPTGTVCTIDPNNLDCRQFIDADGNTYPRLLSSVVFATDDCRPYRREVDGSIIYGIKSLSNSCSAVAVGCREYRGNNGNVVKIILNDDFENATTSGWMNGTLSLESVYVGGHSLDKDSYVYKEVKGLIDQDKSYTISFWAKGKSAGDLVVSLLNRNGRVDKTVTIDTEWNYYQVGPFYIDFDIDSTTIENFYFRGVGAYLDNIILREITNSYYLIKDSWETPAICDQPFVGAQLGCQLYDMTDGTQTAVLNFSSLCSDDKVGCKAVIDTQNSSSPYEETFNTENDDPNDPTTYYDNITVPKDSLVYVVDNPDKYCSADAVGCKLMGRVIEDRQTGEIIGFSDEFVIDNPDDYTNSANSILCSQEGLYCEEYSIEGSGKAYYINPGNRVCEFRKDEQTGLFNWYKQGTDEICETERVCSNDLNTACQSDADCDFSASGGTVGICISREPNQPVSSDNVYYDGWVGSCPQDENSCSQYIDPEGEKACTNNQFTSCTQDADCLGIYDKNGNISDGLCRPSFAKSSYYYLSTSVDSASCNGVVNRVEGCRLFDKTDGIPSSYTAGAYSSALTPDGSAPVSDPSFVYVNNQAFYYNNDANTILKVDKDRVCSEWLYCQTRVEDVDEQGNKVDRCFSVGLCNGLDSNNECNSFPPVKKACSLSGNACQNDFDCLGGAGDVCEVIEITAEQNRDINSSSTLSYDPGKYSIEDIRYLSGYSKAGINWTGFGPGKNGTIYGYYPYSKMYEVGNKASVNNGSFEEVAPEDPTTVGKRQTDDYPFVGWRTDKYDGCLESGGGSICSVSVDKDNKVDGKNSAKLSISQNNPGEIARLRLIQFMDLAPGDYVLSGYMKWSGVYGTTTATTRPRANVEVFWDNNSSSTSLGGVIGGSKGFRPFSLRFQNTTSDVNIRLILWEVEGGTVWFDDIKIEPALKVADNPNETLVRQSCRLYPADDAASCEYERGSKAYRGWRGYCVEPDPNNANYCINWWPVDLIKGSSADIGEESLTFNERAPLYYCLQAKGLKSRSSLPQNASNGDSEVAPDWDNYTVNLLPEYRIGRFVTYTGLYVSTDHGPVEQYIVTNDEVSNLTFNDIAFFRIEVINQTGETFNGVYYLYPDDTVVINNNYTWSKRYTSPGNCSNFNSYNCVEEILKNNDYVDYQAFWNQDGTLDRFLVRVFDPSPGSGGGTFRIYAQLRDSCYYLAKVSDVRYDGVESYPYFTRVSPSSGYEVSGLNYNYYTDESPFGSSVISGLDSDPNRWDSRDDEQGTQPIYLEVENTTNSGPNIRAGTAYSCQVDGSCDYAVCYGGSENGRSCSSVDTANKCYKGGGICYGSLDPNIANANNKDLNFAIDRLSELYAKSLGVWQWQCSAGGCSYEPTNISWDNTNTGTNPKVYNIKVNGTIGNVVLTGGGGNIRLTFNSDANDDQLPLRSYRIDWGDSSGYTSYQGSFNEKVSVEDPHVVYHTYQYDPGNSRPCRDFNIGLDDGSCSSYQITVEVTDNWGLSGSDQFNGLVIVQQ